MDYPHTYTVIHKGSQLAIPYELEGTVIGKYLDLIAHNALVAFECNSLLSQYTYAAYDKQEVVFQVIFARPSGLSNFVVQIPCEIVKRIRNA